MNVAEYPQRCRKVIVAAGREPPKAALRTRFDGGGSVFGVDGVMAIPSVFSCRSIFVVDWFSVVPGFNLRFSGGALWPEFQPDYLFLWSQVVKQIDQWVRLSQHVFKNGSRRREEADFGAETHLRLVTSAATALAAVFEPVLHLSRAVQFLEKRAMKPPPLLSSIANASPRRVVVFSI